MRYSNWPIPVILRFLVLPFLCWITTKALGAGTPGSTNWEFQTEGPIEAAPAVALDGTVYVGSHDFKVYAVAGVNGEKKWEFKTGGPVSSSPTIGNDGTVYVGSSHGLYALNGDTGALKWVQDVGGRIYSCPAIGVDGSVIVGNLDAGAYYAFDGTTGIRKWEFNTGGQVWASPAIAKDGTVYVGSSDFKIYALNGLNGTKKWEFLTGAKVWSSPAVGSDGTVYAGSDDSKLYALDGNTGVKKWETTVGIPIQASPAIGAGGTVYVGFHSALDGVTGALKWQTFLGSGIQVSSAAIGDDGSVYLALGRSLFALDGQNGAKMWEFLTGGDIYSSPAIGPNGTVYIGSRDGKLYAINSSSTGLSNSPWPMFHGGPLHGGRVFPNITIQPQNVAANLGDNVKITVESPNATKFQWMKDGIDIPRATNATLILNNIQRPRIGDYRVVVSNGGGSVTSSVASLNIKGIDSGIWKGLVALYSFNGNGNDDSGNENNGIIENVIPTTDRFGYPSSAFRFDGSSSAITTPEIKSFPSGEVTMTYSCWINESYESTLSGLFQVIVGVGQANEKNKRADLGLYYDNLDGVNFMYAGAWNDYMVRYSGGNFENKWQQITVVKNGKKYHFT